MKDIEKLPFANNLMTVIKEEFSQIQDPSEPWHSATRYLKKELDELASTASWQEVDPEFKHEFLINQIRKTNTFYSAELSAFMIQTEHPFIADFSDTERRYLLDTALSLEIAEISLSLLREKTLLVYYQGDCVNGQTDVYWLGQIRRLEGIQKKLRQKENPGSKERET